MAKIHVVHNTKPNGVFGLSTMGLQIFQTMDPETDPNNIPRHNKTLASTIEMLGTFANGDDAILAMLEINEG